MSAAAPDPKANQGRPVPRIEARLKVTGEAPYATDIPVENLAHAVLVTSDIARGHVKAMHLDEARTVPGVLDILTYGDADELNSPKFANSSMTSVQPLKQRDIRHDGQIVALVVAGTLEAAQEAAYKVSVDYEAEQPTATFGSPGAETIPAVGNTEKMKEDPKTGDFQMAFSSSPVTLDVEYKTPPQHHNPIELFSTTAVWHGENLTVYEPSQTVYGFRRQIAEQLGIDQARVRVVSPYVGGAFRSKGPMSPRTAIVALAAKRLGRPVRCVVTRRQAFTTQTYRAETRHHVRMAAGHDGKLTGYSHEGWEVTSRPDNYVVGGTEGTVRIYAYGAVATKVNLVKADRQTPGYMRSPPELPYVFALESAMDEMAERCGIDPVEFRRLNDTDKDPVTGAPYSSRSLMECFDAASKAFGWASRNPKPGSTRRGDWLVGLGCATAYYPTNVAASTARVRLLSTGKAVVQTATHEIGTGIRTVAAQMAAERLGLAIEDVSVEAGDTTLPTAPVSGGSNSTASVCSTVQMACNGIRDKLFRAIVGAKGGPLRGRNPADFELKSGVVRDKDGAFQRLEEAFQTAQLGAIEEYAEFIPAGLEPNAAEELYRGQTSMRSGSSATRPSVRRGADNPGKMMFAFGAEFVEVQIHARTREIRIPRLVGAFAAGRIMNTRTARSQLMGGLIWGLSAALLEATEVDERNARYINRDLQDYYVPANADINEVEVLLLSEGDHEVNPAGVKGLGELGDVGTNAAIANAVYHATGRRIRELPLRIENLIE